MDLHVVTLLSFGFLYGLPAQADLVLDTRGMANPYYVKDLSALTGCDAAVQQYIWQDAPSRAYRDAIVRMLQLRMELYERWDSPNRKPLTVAVGCSGGRHRSVATVIYLAQQLRAWGYRVVVIHRELDSDSKS